MTEAEWLNGTDPVVMLDFVRGKATDRQLRLFACACVRRIWNLLVDERSREAIEVTEQFADDRLLLSELLNALEKAMLPNVQIQPQSSVSGVVPGIGLSGPESLWTNRAPSGKPGERIHYAILLRHIVGNPFRPYAAPGSWPVRLVKMAQALYDGTGDRLVLADALDEAGHQELAQHFRAEEWHPKGCCVVDLVLGKE
ncbi:hypothetical protein AYO44_12690 [Planctomycetaceae bacterium SCGC AG-212-F19]|nr:hypothetical protein AYO44_12690 [Planctomycetaceae bacterium SCGC AG-212-F19]